MTNQMAGCVMPVPHIETPLQEHPIGEQEHPFGQQEHPIGQQEHPIGEQEHPIGEQEHPIGEQVLFVCWAGIFCF